MTRRYERAIRENAPTDIVLTALEIRHPAITEPARVVNDTTNRVIGDETFIAVHFEARLASDTESRAPQAELVIDNVGRELTQWIEAAEGGIGASVRVMQVLAIEDPEIEWEMTMDVTRVRSDQAQIVVGLGFDPMLSRPAVSLRHDPQTSPGLF